MLRDVSCGMRFLHEDMQIIHRDLKPENILLCHRDNETVYKITDLGYAKRIDVNSICMSFVGTLQYLVCYVIIFLFIMKVKYCINSKYKPT